MAKEAQDTKITQTEDPAMATVTNDELLALHASQNEVIADQQARIASLEALVAKLEKGQAASAPKGGTIAKVGKDEYQVLHGLRIAGHVLTPAEIAAKPELCEQLVADRSGALKKL